MISFERGNMLAGNTACCLVPAGLLFLPAVSTNRKLQNTVV